MSNIYRVIVSFEVEADSEDEAVREASDRAPDATIESVVEVVNFK